MKNFQIFGVPKINRQKDTKIERKSKRQRNQKTEREKDKETQRQKPEILQDKNYGPLNYLQGVLKRSTFQKTIATIKPAY